MMTACSHNTQGLTETEKREIITEVNSYFGKLVAAAKTLMADRYLAILDAERYTVLNEDGTVTHSFDEFAERYAQGIAHIKNFTSLEFSNEKSRRSTTQRQF